MRCEYTLEVRGVCPVDKGGDVYTVTVRSRRTVMVEAILAAVEKFTGEHRTQEDLTDRLSRELGAEVESVGWHSGVFTRVVCGELPDAATGQRMHADDQKADGGQARPVGRPDDAPQRQPHRVGG